MHLLKLHPSILDYVRLLGPETPERMVTERKLRVLEWVATNEQLAVAKFSLLRFSEFCHHQGDGESPFGFKSPVRLRRMPLRL